MGCGSSMEGLEPEPVKRTDQPRDKPKPRHNEVTARGASPAAGRERDDASLDMMSPRGGDRGLRGNRPAAQNTPSGAKSSAKYKKKVQKSFKQALKYEIEQQIAKDNKYQYDAVRMLLVGHPDQKLHNTAKVVRIFTSSTFTDTKHERNELMEKVYPKLKTYCRELGYEFQVVDMRWGIRDEASDDHTTAEICLKELQQCRELSTGPSFVTFLSHKYGYRPFPRRIPADEFEKITQDATGEDADMLQKWLKKDVNASPPEYVLQPISHGYPDCKSEDREKSDEAWRQWLDTSDRIQNLLIKGAEKYLSGPDPAHNYQMSVTEREIQMGILESEDPLHTCLWFKRTFADIDTARGGRLRRFMECKDTPEDVLARDLMRHLKDKLAQPKYLSADSIVDYDVHWDDGINPDNPEHRQYLDKLCEDFETKLVDLIQRAAVKAAREEHSESFYREALQHSAFRHAKCKSFTGRESVLVKMEEYVKAAETSTPFVLHGHSGCGKTSIMAKAATDTWGWLGGHVAIVYRFIGTSQESSTVRLLLNSINDQIMAIYAPELPRKNERQEIKALTEEFLLYVSCIPEEKPLVLLLDSLDQLDGADGGRQLDWLPKQLPPSVKIILSTLPQEQYICFSRCKAMFPENQWVVEVPGLTTNDIDGILDSWLKRDKRTLTLLQRQLVIDTLVKHPLPLLLKLSFDEAVQWHSYDAVEHTVLQESVPLMIHALFDHLEKRHGTVIVQHSLSYLSAARMGLTVVEIEDILSLSDHVLNDVYQYWTPPLRRLPPLLWIRIKNDIQEYVVYRGADGAQVIYWYHRQFIETAQERYLKDDAFRKQCHQDIAEYFMGKWANKAKPYKDKKGVQKEADRYVSDQPIMFTKTHFNIRKLNQLPYHIIQAGERATLKREVVCNYEFLLAKITCLGLRSVLSDLKAAQMAFPNDRDISVVLEALQLSSDALTHSPNELAGQLVGRIHDYGGSTVQMVEQAKAVMQGDQLDEATKDVIAKIIPKIEELMAKMDAQLVNLKELCAQARESSISVLIPHTGFLVPPGGQLLHKISGHFEKINDISMSADAKILATASDDKTVKLWNIYTGAVLRSVDLPAEVKFLVFLKGHRLIASCTQGTIVVIDSQNGEIIRKLKTEKVATEYTARPIVAVHVEGKPYIIAPRTGFIDIYDLKTGDIKVTFADDLKVEKTKLWGEQKVITGALNYLIYSAFADDDFYVVPLENLTQINIKKVNVFAEEANWMNLDSHDHISDLAIAEEEKQIIVVNGKTREFIFFDLETRQKLAVFNKNKEITMSDMRYSAKEHSLYYTADNEVGQLGIGSDTLVLSFRHPCKVSKVASKDGRLVATIAEDNILRVWDKVMEPFKPDLSAITGQVHVSSDSEGAVSSMMGDLLGGIEVDASAAMTTKDVKNYWTKDASSSTNEKVYTKFHALPGNDRYVVVVQYHHESKVLTQWTRCLSIWDIETVKIVRRAFFPLLEKDTLGTMHVHCMVDKEHAFVQHNGFDIGFKLLNLKTWKLTPIKTGKSVKKVWKSIVFSMPHKKVVVAETQFDRLTVYDLQDRAAVAYLIISEETTDWHLKRVDVAFPYRTQQMTVHKFDNIQMSDDGTRLLTVWGHWIITVWSTDGWSQLHEFKMLDYFKTLDARALDSRGQSVTLGNVTEDQFLLVSANTEAKSKDHNSSCVLNINAGKFVGYTFAHKENVQVLQKIQIEGMGALLQTCDDQPRHLQWVGVGRDGDSVVIDEQMVGLYANSMVMSDNASHYVTWCTEPQEKTIKLWGVVDGKLSIIGAFTPDEEVFDVFLVSEENMIIINTASGLVKLQLCGREVAPLQSPRSKAPVDYKDIELTIDVTPDQD